MKTNLTLALLLALIFSAAGCKKYEKGPALSFRSKTERISNKWKIYQVYEGGQDKTADYKNTFYNWINEMKSDGKYTLTYRPGNLFDYTETGTWKFIEDNTKVYLDKDGSNDDGSWTIIKLKEDEVWVKTTYNNTEIELRLIPAS